MRGLWRGCGADCVVLPRPSLDYFGRHFLDSMTVDELESRIGLPVTFATQWKEVLRILLYGPGRPGPNAAPNGAFWSEPAAERVC